MPNTHTRKLRWLLFATSDGFAWTVWVSIVWSGDLCWRITAQTRGNLGNMWYVTNQSLWHITEQELRSLLWSVWNVWSHTRGELPISFFVMEKRYYMRWTLLLHSCMRLTRVPSVLKIDPTGLADCAHLAPKYDNPGRRKGSSRRGCWDLMYS